MELMVLDATLKEEQKQWLDHWSSWPDREPMAHPSYVQLFARDQDRARCACARTDQGGILFPFIERPLSAETWAANEKGCDLISPYGYGGAFVWGDAVESGEAFWDRFDEWAEESGVVTTFVRLGLFEDQLLPFRGTTEVRFSNVVRSLTESPEVIWKDYARKVRKNVNKARKAGLKVEVDLTGDRLEDFLAIYKHTMKRRDASQGYYFPAEFFETIIRDLSGYFAMFHVMQSDKVVSTELALVSSENVYSFLGGTLEESFDLRPNDLLKDEMIRWGHAAQKKRFILGGGYGQADGIFRYKLSFAPSGEVSFRVGMRTYNESTAERLVGVRNEWFLEQGLTQKPLPGFFPPYRS